MRAVLDTTVWCSAFLSRNENSAARRIWNAWRNRTFVAVVSGPIVDEVARVLFEELGVPEADVEEFVVFLCRVADVVPIKHQVMGCRDRNDDAFLETAVVGAANYIVTHDDDLLTLPASVRDFLRGRGVELVADARAGERDFCDVLRDLEASEPSKSPAIDAVRQMVVQLKARRAELEAHPPGSPHYTVNTRMFAHLDAMVGLADDVDALLRKNEKGESSKQHAADVARQLTESIHKLKNLVALISEVEGDNYTKPDGLDELGK